VADVQNRLATLGYNLGNELAQEAYGPLTEQAVAAFRADAGLPAGIDVDKSVWSALVDATFNLGDRVLYLRMPYFHGRDVQLLQDILGSLGFSCPDDGIFGAHTERAVREFQVNVGLDADGIVGDSTFAAIERLRHAWDGKTGVAGDLRVLGFARAARVLEEESICVFGLDDTARAIAQRISNLALATTSASRVVSAQDLGQVPADTMLMVGLSCSGPVPVDAQAGKAPIVVFDSDETINARLHAAITTASATERLRVMVQLDLPVEGVPGNNASTAWPARQLQHCAITLLDAICLAFD
jgi:peptidoglycan hydrolase-like protein with peptidoglycan-binding domain